MAENNERQFETDVESIMTGELGWTKATERGYVKWREQAMDVERLVDFVKATQQNAWRAFERACGGLDVYRAFYRKFEDAVGAKGLVDVLRNGFHANGKKFFVVAFRPENSLNDTANENYGRNVCQFVRQWHYSAKTPEKSVDVTLMVNGIPLAAIELKDQLKGQTVDHARMQWMGRSPKEDAFRVNHRVLAFFAVDLSNAFMTTRLDGQNTRFLPFNQGSAGAGNDGGAGNPPPKKSWTTGPRAQTDYLWRDVLAKDSFLDILQKFVNWDKERRCVVFPRFHQLDVVRKVIADVRRNGSGKSYLVQHSAGSGKSNSIAWIAYRLASLFGAGDRPVFSSVVIVTDLRVLDKQLQDTVMSFNPALGQVAVIDEGKTAQDLLAAIEDGRRIIVSTLQKFPVIFRDVRRVEGKRFAIIVDEAHSSQTGQSAAKMRYALADLRAAIAEYEAETGKTLAKESVNDPDAQLALLMCAQGQHANLSYFAFTATPKDVTLDLFGTRQKDGSFRPFHTYSMRQAIEEEFIHDVLAYYTTYRRCTRIVKAIPDNPEVPVCEAAKTIRRYASLHPKNFLEKSAVIADTFLDVTERKYPGAKMMVVADSRLAAVRYFGHVKEALKARGRTDVQVMVAFSGAVEDPPQSGTLFTEESLNRTRKGRPVKETQTKGVFHEEGGILIVAEKYQTGFDEPLLHTMVVDRKLRGVKAVQTLSRVNRTCDVKSDTFILDFVNTDEEIRESFQPFYQQTMLENEINVDLVFAKLDEIRAFALYTTVEVERVASIHFTDIAGKKGASTQGAIVGALTEVQKRYQALAPKRRALYRRQVRAFVRWYNYLSQITRVFDADTAKEHVFLSYLQHLLPADPSARFELEDSVTLQYYKLQKTFSGQIRLQGKGGVYEPPKPRTPAVMEQRKDALQTVIDAINAEYSGEFTEQDRVIMEMILPILFESPKLRSAASSQDEKVYMDGVFPGEIDKAVLEAYRQSDKAFQALLENKEKFEAFKLVLAKHTFREFQQRFGAATDEKARAATPDALWASGQAGVETPVPDGYVAVLPLQAKWYEQIQSGVKRVEYREVAPRSTTMLVTKRPVAVRLMYGYSRRSMVWQIASVTTAHGRYEIHLGKRLV